MLVCMHVRVCIHMSVWGREFDIFFNVSVVYITLIYTSFLSS